MTKAETATFILERNVEGWLDLFEHCDHEDGRDRDPVTDFCVDDFVRLFPGLASLPYGCSQEVEITIKPIGDALPWKDWTWKDV